MTLKTITSVRQKSALVLFGVVLSLVILETGMRLGGFILLSIQEQENLISIKQKGAYRVLCLGESTTQRQYPRFLGKILNENKRGMRFSVIDKGSTGTDTSIILNHIESYLDEHHPQMVVAMMGINDQGVHYYQDIPEKNTWIFQECHAYRLFRTLFKLFIDPIKQKDDVSSELEWDVDEHSEFSVAEDSFRRAIKADPRNDRAYLNLGRSQQSCGKNSQAEISFLKAVELNPQGSDAYFELGQIYQCRGQWILARNSFEKALALNPNSYKAYMGLKRLFREQGVFSDQDDAFLKEAVERVPSFNSYMILGRFYHGQGKWAFAEEAFQKAAPHNPRDCSPYLWLGEVYRFQGKLPEALVQYERAIEVNPKSSAAMGGLISTYEELGKTELASEWSQRALLSGVMSYSTRTAYNFRKLKRLLDRKGIKLICVQYPMRNIAPLKKIFEGEEGVIFVDNERVFKDALKKASYQEYFVDMFAGDFGHCTAKGNELLAQNIADVILKELFGKTTNSNRKAQI